MSKPVLDDVLELLSQFDERLKRIEDAPPPQQWAYSVAYLLREFVTTKTVTTAVSILTGLIFTIYSMFNGVPLP